ncbi:glycoside hydrolase family 19 protein [Phycicoccus flavus]|uniref:glycoside hydrolase family 19 protein n=1 Tax=Phycicoccus flavus TaxID=2502783 RepID=UPI000FEC1FF4|nr:glycoside hydrolase family 19 protein [Phycicoccus flavus]NHA70103.1 hypothetical protein [Phycicoccus flavus]
MRRTTDTTSTTSTGRTGRAARRLAAAGVTALVAAGLAAGPASAETWRGGAGNDTHTGTNAADTLRGGDGADEIHGRGGDDQIYGGNGNDSLYGDDGADTLWAGLGSDRLFGGAGPDTLHADDMRPDTLVCGDGGNDVAYADYKDMVGATCETKIWHEITYEDLTAMFPGKVGPKDTVTTGLSGLNAQMRAGQIDVNAKRVSAFLATLANESTFRYNALQAGTSTYRGRGYIQLTNDFNYRAAGSFFGVDFVRYPDKARSLAWSAKIARWYWYDNRHANGAADAMDMGRVSKFIGYAASRSEDAERCEDFKRAMKYLTGTRPADSQVTCYRH